MTHQRVKYPGILRQLMKKRNGKQELNTHYKESQMDSTLLDYYISFVQNHPDIILVFSLDGEVVSQNRNMLNEYLGYHPKIDIEFRELVSEDTYILLQASFDKAVKGVTERLKINIYNQ